MHPLTEHFLRLLAADFTRTGNPLFAFQAVQLCARSSTTFPPWLVQYLARAADNLLRLANDPKQAAGQPQIVNALSFGGRGPSKFKQWRDYRGRRESRIYAEVLEARGTDDAQQKKNSSIAALKKAYSEGKMTAENVANWTKWLNDVFMVRTPEQARAETAQRFHISSDTVKNRRTPRRKK